MKLGAEPQTLAIELLGERAHAAEGEEDLHKRGSRHLFGRNRRVAGRQPADIEPRTRVGQYVVGHSVQVCGGGPWESVAPGLRSRPRHLGIFLVTQGKSGKAGTFGSGTLRQNRGGLYSPLSDGKDRTRYRSRALG